MDAIFASPLTIDPNYFYTNISIAADSFSRTSCNFLAARTNREKNYFCMFHQHRCTEKRVKSFAGWMVRVKRFFPSFGRFSCKFILNGKPISRLRLLDDTVDWKNYTPLANILSARLQESNNLPKLVRFAPLLHENADTHNSQMEHTSLVAVFCAKKIRENIWQRCAFH